MIYNLYHIEFDADIRYSRDANLTDDESHDIYQRLMARDDVHNVRVVRALPPMTGSDEVFANIAAFFGSKS